MLAEFDRLNIPNYYETIEIISTSYLQSRICLLNLLNFVHPEVSTSKSSIKKCLDDAASASIMASRRIFLVRECKEWHTIIRLSTYVYIVAYNIFLYSVLPCHVHIDFIRGPDCGHMLPEDSYAHTFVCCTYFHQS